MAADLDRLRELRREADDLLLQQIRAPYSRMTPWATTQSCAYLGHPAPHDDIPGPCICGKTEGWLTERPRV